MAKKSKKAHNVRNKAKQNGRKLLSASLDSDLSTCAPGSEDTPMAEAASMTTEKQGKSMSCSLSPCKHLSKGVNCKKFLRQIANSQVLQCDGCAKLNEGDSTWKKGKKGKGKKSTKKGNTMSKDFLQSEDDWPTNTWVCLSCGYVGCGSRPDSFLEGENKERVAISSSEETINSGHAFQHCLGVNHPCALQCGDKILCRCFLCRSTLQYNFSEAANGEDQVADNEGNWRLSILQAWKAVQEKLAKESTTVHGISTTINEEESNEKSRTFLVVDKADGLVLSGRVIKGLTNLGNTCFFNSVMQNLLALDVLRDHFTKSNAEFVGPVTCSLRKLYMETSLESQLGDKAGEMETTLSNSSIKKGRKSKMSCYSSNGIISPNSLVSAIRAKAPRFMGFQQQDSHELLKYLLDSLKIEELNARKSKSKQLWKSPGESQNGQSANGQGETDMHTIQNNSHSDMLTFVDNIFGGQLSSTVCCCVCGFSSVVYEPFLDLSLPIPTKETAKKSFLTREQNKNAPVSGHSVKKQLQKDDSKGQKRRGKKTQVSCMKKTEAEDEMVDSGKFSLSANAENFTLGTVNGPTTTRDSEQINCLLLRNQSAERPCPSPFDQSETVEKIEETDVQGIAHKCNGILLDDSEMISAKQISDSIYQSGYIVDKNGVCSPSKNPIIMESHFDCQERSAIDDNKINGEHVDMDCDDVDHLCNKETPSVQKQEEKCRVENIELCQEKGRQDLCKTEIGTDSERSNGVSKEVISNTIIPMSVDGCFTSFTRPELLSGENAWECDRCSTMLGRVSTNVQTTMLEEMTNMEFSATLVSESGKNKTLSKRGTHDITDNNPSEFCGLEERDFHRTKECPSLIDQDSERSSTLQEHQMGTGESGSNNVIEEDQNILQGRRHVTRSSLRVRERSCKELGGEEFNQKEDCGKVAAHQRKSVRSRGRKQNLEENEFMEAQPKKVKRDATKQYLISNAPQILTIHLKRFTQDMRGRLSKLSGHVMFQEKLDLRPYLHPKCTEKERSIYRLIGIVEHSGSMRGGHYVAYVRGPQNENDLDMANDDFVRQSTWYNISDGHVSKSSLSDVLGSEAYLLFYEKCKN